MPAMSRKQLADAIEDHTTMIVAALREQGASGDDEPRTSRKATDASATPTDATACWTRVGTINDWETKWPLTDAWKALGHEELLERYPQMDVYEARDEQGVVRLAIGEPTNRYPVYGRERGLLSVWEVRKGEPVRQLANFIEVDDFEETGDRAALISGKDGAAKKGFAPNERHLLQAVYDGMRVEVQNERIVGPNSRNRLVVVAREDEVNVMLDHALAHLRLRGTGSDPDSVVIPRAVVERALWKAQVEYSRATGGQGVISDRDECWAEFQALSGYLKHELMR